jgi:hypothetical protein
MILINIPAVLGIVFLQNKMALMSFVKLENHSKQPIQYTSRTGLTTEAKNTLEASSSIILRQEAKLYSPNHLIVECLNKNEKDTLYHFESYSGACRHITIQKTGGIK